MMKKKVGFYLGLFLFLSGCGYHFENHSYGSLSSSQPKTISVPYITGDYEGRLTSQLIYTLSSMGKWRFVEDHGDFLLRVSILDQRSEEVGYNRPFENGQFLKWLVPNENRLSLLVQVELIEQATQKIILGPKYISSSVLYDYDPDFNTQNFVRFSLAQYNFQEISARTARQPLEGRLAKAIVDYLNFGW